MNMHPTATQNSRKSPWLVPMLALGIGLLAGFGGVLFPPATVTLQPGGKQPGTVATNHPSKNESGRLLYLAHCARCHGPTGQGDGPESTGLAQSARPRDFTGDNWKYNSSREAIEQVLLKGIPGTPMAAFGSTLGDLDRRQLVEFVISMAPPAARLPNDQNQRDFVKNLVAQAGWQWSSDIIRPSSLLATTAINASEISLNNLFKDSRQPVTGLFFVQIWGIHCTVCIEKLPEVVDMNLAIEQLGYGFEFLCADEPDIESVKQCLQTHNINITSLIDHKNSFKLGTDLSLLPVTLLMDANGQIHASRTGIFDWKKDLNFAKYTLRGH